MIQSFDELPAALGETHVPRTENFEVYVRARERQKRMYHLLLD